jgi:hypothetical protein
MHPPLSDVPDSIACDPSVAEIVLLDVRWDRFGVTAGFVRPILVKDVIRPKPVEGHMRPPLVVPELKFLTQVGKMIDAVLCKNSSDGRSQ